MIQNDIISISYKQEIVQVNGNIVSDMDGEKVLLSVKKGKYYNLGEIGGRIWDLVETPLTVDQLVETLLMEYDVGEAECVEHVFSFLDHLLEEGLIQIPEKH